MTDKTKTSPLEILENKKRINVCAPMVRYSKLPFRELVRKYVLLEICISFILVTKALFRLGTTQTLSIHP